MASKMTLGATILAKTRKVEQDRLKVCMDWKYGTHRLKCFIKISGTDETVNLTCEVIYDNFTMKIIVFQPIINNMMPV